LYCLPQLLRLQVKPIFTVLQPYLSSQRPGQKQAKTVNSLSGPTKGVIYATPKRRMLLKFADAPVATADSIL
jgi:hypothetical protein